MNINFFFLPLCLILAFTGVPAGGADPETKETTAADFSSPKATLMTVIAAVGAKDLEAYKACFTPAALENREAGVEDIEKNPDKNWKELQGIFHGPQNVKSLEMEGDNAYLEIEAPEADQGGIGSMRMKKIDGAWKIDRW